MDMDSFITHTFAKSMSNKYGKKLVNSAKKICYRSNKNCF